MVVKKILEDEETDDCGLLVQPLPPPTADTVYQNLCQCQSLAQCLTDCVGTHAGLSETEYALVLAVPEGRERLQSSAHFSLLGGKGCDFVHLPVQGACFPVSHVLGFAGSEELFFLELIF